MATATEVTPPKGTADPPTTDGEASGTTFKEVVEAVQEANRSNIAKEVASAAKKPKRRLDWAQVAWAVALAAVVTALIGHKASSDQSLQQLMAQMQAANATAMGAELKVKLAEMASSLPAFEAVSTILAEAPPRVGQLMAEDGLSKKHPVLMVPGFVASGLELWQGRACGRRYFRQRMWGTMAMLQTFMRDKDCWLVHMSLDPKTGVDPEGIKVRAAKGLESVDFFVEGYWVFAKMVESLADIGYTSTDLVGLAYDWRLSLSSMEERDGWHSELKSTVELMHAHSKQKVAIVSHSMGGTIAFNFLTWVSATDPAWVETHVAHWVNLAGALLGAPKAMTAALSGEMRDTAQLASLASYMTDRTMAPNKRRDLFRSWLSLLTLYPAGGNRIWGNGSWAPDDDANITAAGRSYGTFLATVRASTATTETQAQAGEEEQASNSTRNELSSDDVTLLTESLQGWIKANVPFQSKPDAHAGAPQDSAPLLHPGDPNLELMTVEDMVKAIMEDTGPTYANFIRTQSAATIPKELRSPPAGSPAPAKVLVPFQSPLEEALPKAPSLKVWCIHGVGKPTERSYHYVHSPAVPPSESNPNGTAAHWRVNKLATDEPNGLLQGVQLADGDGTVPLISLGLMCQMWRNNKRLNPSAIQVTTREYLHQPISWDLRSGPNSSDHVDMLGNDGVLRDVLHVVSGNHSHVQDQYSSEILRIAANVKYP